FAQVLLDLGDLVLVPVSGNGDQLGSRMVAKRTVDEVLDLTVQLLQPDHVPALRWVAFVAMAPVIGVFLPLGGASQPVHGSAAEPADRNARQHGFGCGSCGSGPGRQLRLQRVPELAVQDGLDLEDRFAAGVGTAAKVDRVLEKAG